MKMEKKKFRIGELADQLALERFVIRFWEKEFGIRPRRSSGGQRFYDETDLHKFATIKDLLYDKKFTIAGAKDFLKQHKLQKLEQPQAIIASHITTLEPEEAQAHVLAPNEITSEEEIEILKKMVELRSKLHTLKNLL